MSYCKINIGGQERGLKFNQMAILILQEKTDKEFPLQTAAYALIYAGLRANAYVKGEEFTATFEQVCEWVDSVSDEDMQLVNEKFMETEAYKRGASYQAEQEKLDKKKGSQSALKNTRRKATK